MSARTVLLALSTAAFGASLWALPAGAQPASRMTTNPGVGAPQVGSGIPPEVTTKGSGPGGSTATGGIPATGPDTIVVDRRSRVQRARARRQHYRHAPRAAYERATPFRYAQSANGTGNPKAGTSGTSSATSSGQTDPARTGASPAGGNAPVGGVATSGTGQNARGGAGVSGASSTGSGNSPK